MSYEPRQSGRINKGQPGQPYGNWGQHIYDINAQKKIAIERQVLADKMKADQQQMEADRQAIMRGQILPGEDFQKGMRRLGDERLDKIRREMQNHHAPTTARERRLILEAQMNARRHLVPDWGQDISRGPVMPRDLEYSGRYPDMHLGTQRKKRDTSPGSEFDSWLRNREEMPEHRRGW